MIVAGLEADFQTCFEHGWTDGLPVVPPYGELVDEMLAAIGWKPTDVLAVDEEMRVQYRAEQVASIAVMAGCAPSHARVLKPLAELLVAPTFNLRGVATTTGGVAVLVIVSGPVVKEIGLEHGSNALGCPVRANVTIGRFAQMVRHLFGRSGGILDEFGTLGHPGRISFLVAEHDQTVWPPFHTQYGFDRSDSSVGIMAAEGPNSVNNHYAETGEQVLETIANNLAHYGTTNFYYQGGGYLIVVPPEHLSLIAASFSRDQARAYLYEHAVVSSEKLRSLGRLPKSLDAVRKVDMRGTRSPVAAPDQITFIESGGSAGKFSAIIPGWVTNVTHVKSLTTGRTVTARTAEF